MATFSCYGAQVVLVFMLITFATSCFRNGFLKLGGWSAAIALATTILWQCQYTVGCQ